LEPELYDRFYEADQCGWWFVGRRRIVLQELQRFATPARLLDVGCGTGGELVALQGSSEVVGIDLSPLAAGYCRERDLPVALASGLQIPFRDSAFDAAILLDVIEHVADDVAMLKEARRVLAPGGVAVITVPALPWLWSEHDVRNHHHRRYVQSTLQAAISSAGFDALKVSYYNSLLLPMALSRKVWAPNGSGEIPPGPLNAIFREVLSLEQRVIQHWSIPIGASLVAVVRRPG
jgi:SAM-dependent methyltransferase